MKTTKIEWTDKTWNPITGCTKYSAGCAHCYAEVMSRRLHAMGLAKYANGFQLTMHEDALNEPKAWKKPHVIFVCSMSDLFHADVPQNAWLGVTCESPAVKYRIDALRGLQASIKFLSCEPLIEALGEMDLTGIDWVIVGGESGPKARLMKEEWVLQIQNQCEKQGATFFFKQWGTWGSDGIKRSKHENGKLLKGKVWQAMPA